MRYVVSLPAVQHDAATISGDAQPRSSAIVRARYDDADVRGVNRYKHFHRPLIVEDQSASGSNGESIDKKLSPRRSPTGVAAASDRRIRSPQHESYRYTTAHYPADAVLPQIHSNSDTELRKLVNNGHLRNQTHPRRNAKLKKRQPLCDGGNRTSTSDGGETSTKNHTDPIAATTLPGIHQNASTHHNNGYNTAKSSNQTVAQQTTTSDMPVIDTHNTEVTQKKRDALIELQQQRCVSRPTPPAVKTKSESAVQTETSHQSTSTVIESRKRLPKATQTDDSTNIFSRRPKNFLAENVLEIEQRTELLEIIDDALSETIDQQSRLIANQFIASSARQQAQVWKDAKEFVAVILVPCSVEMAKKTRYKRRPLDSAARIQLPSRECFTPVLSIMRNIIS